MCEELKAIPELKDGFNAIGFSQGADLSRDLLSSRPLSERQERDATPCPCCFCAVGGQFMRAVVERCQDTGPPARTLITLGAQHQVCSIFCLSWTKQKVGTACSCACWAPAHSMAGHHAAARSSAQGIVNIPACGKGVDGGSVASTACTAVQTLLGMGAYAPWVHDHVIQAQYFKVEDFVVSHPGGVMPLGRRGTAASAPKWCLKCRQ